MLRSCALASLLWCMAGPAAAIHVVHPAGQPLDLVEIGAPSFTSFSSRDGVPDAVSVSVLTDSEGFVWAASPLGLARYDGRRWTADPDPALAESADSLWLDQRGTLWAAFRNRGLARHDGRRWQFEDPRSGLHSQQIRRFAETRNADGSHTLWALTWDQGLMARQDGRWSLDPDNAQLPRGAVLSLAQTRHLGGAARQWLGSGNEGLWFREDGSGWQRFRGAGFDPSQVEYLLATEYAGKEELWISVFSSGLWRLSEDGLRHWSKENGELPGNDLYDMVETPLPGGDRAIWVASRSGLVRIHDDHAQVFDRRHGLPADVVRSVSAWRSPNGDQVLWLATESGIARTIIGANQWQTASLMGAQATGVFAVLVQPDGKGGERLWVGASNDGIGLFEQGRWRHFTQANSALPDSTVRLITAAADENGQPALWAGLRYGHLVRIREGPLFEPVSVPWEKHSGEAVLDLLTRRVDGRYEQWAGTRQSGAWRRRDGQWTAQRPAAASGQWRVSKLVEQIAADGRSWLWATTNQGLARYDGGQWTLFGREQGLSDTELTGARLIPDAQGRPVLWIGTANSGVTRVDLSDPLHPAVLPEALPPPPDRTAYSALPDSRGRVYICTNNGVQLLTPQPGGGYTSHVFRRRDGMIHDECNTNGQFVDAHDRYWTGTLGGLTVYDPARASEDRQPKALKLIDLRVDGAAASGPELQIAAAARDVHVEFALLSWQREGESRFRTQLLGYDATPTDWSSDNFRNFSALPPGRYLLRIEGRDYAGNLSAPLELALEKGAHWWQRDWARLALAALLPLLGYAVVLWRTRALQAQRRALELRVAARTEELNAANARLLDLSYRDALTGLSNRRRLLETLEQTPHGSGRAALIFVDVDHFKDYNDRYGHLAGDEALRHVARTLRSHAPPQALVARYGGEEFACLLPGADTEQGLVLAERIRAAVAACPIPVPASMLCNQVTISAGVASALVCDPASAQQLLRAADMALYRAKRDGRNRVRTVEGEMV